MAQSPYYPEQLLVKASQIKLLICDVDGVLSNGHVIFSNSGEELKTFNIKDGLGIKLLQNHGVEVAIITGRESKIVEKRCRELGINHVYQGKKDKVASFQDLCSKLNITGQQVCHIGDDLPDLPLFTLSLLGVCVADGHWFVKQKADWITQAKGGDGAVREISDLLLTSQGHLNDIHNGYWI